MSSTDQSAYMSYAKNLAETNFQFVGGRNRMPVYPGLLSFFYKQGMSDDDFFERGKQVGIAIGLIGLIVAFLVFSQVSRPLDSITGTLVTMFTVFAYKSPYFQAEVLFYTIGLVLFFLLLSLVKKPKVLTAAFAGLVGGIGHLTKASVLPAVLLATLLILVRGTLDLWRRNHHADSPSGVGESRNSRFLLNHLCYVVVLIGCFLFVIAPYIKTSKERFGYYFYNVNSTFYMWYDSWDEVKQGTKAHGDRKSWPKMPGEQIPSLSKYVRDHSFGEILWRIVRGLRVIGYKAALSYGYAPFLLLYGITLLFLSFQNRKKLLSIFLCRVHPCVMIFIVGYFLGYTILYAWYTPIASGNRFMLSLFLPAVFLIVSFLSYAQNHDLFFDVFGIRISASRISPAILLILIAYVLTVFPHTVSTMYGGS